MKYLVDSDFLVGLFLESDALHNRAKELFENINEKDILVMTSLVKMESATVVSNKAGMLYARKFVKFIEEAPLVEVFEDELSMVDGWKLFLSQTKKGSSFIDSMNLVVARKMSCKKILSFDKFYPREWRVNL